jgi:hypothetical protein
MTLTDDIHMALDTAGDMADQATEMADALSGAEMAHEECDATNRREFAEQATELLNELESNARKMREWLDRIAK